MTVLYTVIGSVRDGNVEGAVGVGAEAAKLVARHGGEVNFFLATAAGEQVNTTVFSIEFETPDALGQAFDAMSDDSELQAFQARLNSPTSPTTILSTSMGVEVPLGRTPKAGKGGVLSVHTSRVHPGRMEDALALASEACEFVEANGAVNARMFQLTYAGMSTGMFAFIWEVENMRAHARVGAAFMSEAGAKLVADLNGADAPIVPVSDGLYTRIAL
jgi:hypothetical protein